ncbi:MAG: 1,4-alpha-glucan branching enzyme [Deltaproteobacteria bacterium RIFOXYA12_FULL_61_11]|nr:MAG: 1,4-alpha-glucan branching enzyme [Deltaproteobacteria bacterium RIFOXYA12_FULL_61_11]
MRHDVSRLSDYDIFLFKQGNHADLAEKLGARPMTVDGVHGTHFAVWAPNAEHVAVVGDFNAWDGSLHPLRTRSDSSGIFEGFVPGVGHGALYKYRIQSKVNGYRVDKADPFARYSEVPPRTASVVWESSYQWGDQEWLEKRKTLNVYERPLSIYEVHTGSWVRVPIEGNRSLTYRELAHRLSDYIVELGFTHVEFLPLMEHPFYGSWGYQTTGYFSPTSRYGNPDDLRALVDHLHRRGIGVIFDWVPSHFPNDEHGLGFFDGTHLFEHEDPRQGIHPDWNSLIFNYNRHEIRSFLLSSANYWMESFHIDGIRVDAVASMLYLDYSRQEGQWIPNEYGGRENLTAINFLQRLNEELYARHPDILTIAEESTAWPGVSRPVTGGGLGFGFKWDMGWMHDTLQYQHRDPIFRKHHHGELTFRQIYAYNENFILPLSHDEVVHGKGSLISRMPGDTWQQLANLRLLLGYQYTLPGKKLLFMGGEFGQWAEWNHEHSLDWQLLEYDAHKGMRSLIMDLNHLYRREPGLHLYDTKPEGFAWIDHQEAEINVLSYLRLTDRSEETLAIVCNFSPVPRHQYRLGIPQGGVWREILNTDARCYGGSGVGNFGKVDAEETPWHGRPFSLSLTLPPLGVVVFRVAPLF